LDPDRALPDACRAVSRDAKIISERDIVVSGVSGREMVMEKVGGAALVSARVYVRDNIVYMISSIVPVEKPRADETAKFLQSFTFLDRP
jgi:hypothetical protein